MIRRFGLLLALASIIGWAACGGGGGGSSVTSVTVSCSPSTVISGASSQCTATVSGTGSFSTGVTWTASAGTISPGGLFTAPTVTSSVGVTVTATSTQNTSVAGTATVTVNSTSASGNVAPIVVDAGPSGLGYTSTNVAFVTVTVCVPGTSNCQTIDHVAVDSGSSGLRLLPTSTGGELSLTLPGVNDSSGNQLAECLVFLDGYIWGPIQTADVTVAGESAKSVNVQLIIPSTSSPAVPASCSNQNPSGGMGNEGNSIGDFGANGIIGVGLLPQDCGPGCTSQGNPNPPDFYYDCPSSGCNPTFATLTQQVPNPVALFTSTGDDNGVLIQFPSVPDGGTAPPLNGSLIFGIGTQSNNAIGSATVYEVPDIFSNNFGNMITAYNSQQYSGFVDSGSNGLFFLDTSTTGIPVCTGFKGASDWYCPSNSPDNFTVTNQGQSDSGPVGSAVPASFSIENASTLFGTSNTAFSTLGGPQTGDFDFGLAFFYGKNVFIAIEGAATPPGSGPYYAFGPLEIEAGSAPQQQASKNVGLSTSQQSTKQRN